MSTSRPMWICALLWLTSAGARAQVQPVMLRAEATVQGKTIQLSDLLPFDAAIDARLGAEKISLGRAPEPGSVRVFRGEELRRAVAGEMAVQFPALAVVRNPGWPLRESSIRRALRESDAGRGYDFSQAGLVPPADFATRTADPRLEVLEVRPGEAARTLTASLRCQQRADCGSFLVEIVFDQPVRAATGHHLQSRSDRTAVAKSGGEHLTGAGPVKIALVQPGHPASLRFEGEGFRITTRVLPLQRAGLGQMVRVFDPAARQVSLARVAGKDLLNFREGR